MNEIKGMQKFSALMTKPIFEEDVEGICEKHGTYSWHHIKYENGLENHFQCPKCIEEENEKENAKFEAMEKQRIIDSYIASNIEKEFWEKDFEDYKPENETQNKALETVKQIVEKKSGKVILLGSNGVGKTMLASVAVKKLGGKILSMYEITTLIRQSYTNKATQTELEIVNELASIPFLAIDELGRTKGSDAELNWLSYVLDKRHVRNLPFMIMSNTHLMSKCKSGGCSQCFENYVNNDILSRLRQNTVIINVNGSDYRAKKN